MEEEVEVFEVYPCSLGKVVAVDGSTYIIDTPEGKRVGVLANTDATPENIEADIANPKSYTPEVPKSVTRQQIFQALLNHSSSLTRVALRAGLDGNESALIDFDEAAKFHRDHPLVVQTGENLGLTSDEVDALFIAASNL